MSKSSTNSFINKIIKDLRSSLIGQISVAILTLITISKIFGFNTSSTNHPTPSSQPPLPSPVNSSPPSPSPTLTTSPSPQPEEFIVTKVIDGDTIVLENGEVVRYIGIDTPELRSRSHGGPDCYAIEATNKNKELVLNKKVRLVKDVSERDRYNRLLRYVYVNNTFVNETLVREGYAKAVTYPPDVKYADLFRSAEKEARQEGRGLWSPTACTIPSPTPTPPIQNTSISSPYTCDCTKTCSRISSCEEAYFQLNQCGCYQRDGDHDGVPCETLCR